jgi:biopolymer transport protein ExbB
MRFRCTAALLFLAMSLLSQGAQAWWNKEWTQRTRFTLDTSDKGLPLAAGVNNVAVALRLHSGNFDFAAAREDGADLRVLAADDKTPLKFQVERFDGLNELAIVWVQLPLLAPGSDKNTVHVYAGNAKAGVEPGNAFDAATRAAFHFNDKEGASHDGAVKAGTAPAPLADAILGGGARLAGTPLVWPAADALKTSAGGALSWSLWVKPDAPADATLLQQGPLALKLAGGKLTAVLGPATASGGEFKPGVWTHVALTLAANKLTLYVAGAPVAQADAATPDIAGPLTAGQGLNGGIDEVQVASEARSADWLKVAAASQGVDGAFVKAVKEGEGSAGEGEGGHGGYLGILVGNLTVDAWVVIVILGVMFVVACWVMVSKTLLLGRTAKANLHFLQRFRDGASHEMLKIDDTPALGQSPLYRLYRAGVRELDKRDVGTSSAPLSGASLDAVKAAVDADMVRETHKLNAQMVLLTIAISGGPFLGLLGTVVGVMITFAAIAAAGDVNVNAIAPGIAAALLATVAGLGVAIPALFGYNWLASRIKNISADMQIFVDEFVTRVAEQYGSR